MLCPKCLKAKYGRDAWFRLSIPKDEPQEFKCEICGEIVDLKSICLEDDNG